MNKNYQNEILKIYEEIQEKEMKKLIERKAEISKNHPEIMDLVYEKKKLQLQKARLGLKISSNLEQEQIESKISEFIKVEKELLMLNGYSTEYLDLHYQCEKCKDKGFVNGNIKCTCYNPKLIKIYYKNSELEKSLVHTNFNNFDSTVFSDKIFMGEKRSPRDNLMKIVTRIMEVYLYNFDNQDMNLLFYGNSGTGKTYLTTCIAKDLLDKGYFVLYKTAAELFRMIKDVRFNNNTELEDLLTNADLLIIDDLGSEMISDFNVTELFDLINRRLLSKKKMLISTNLKPSALEKMYTERLTSRILGEFTSFKFYGEDIRVNQNIQKNM